MLTYVIYEWSLINLEMEFHTKCPFFNKKSSGCTLWTINDVTVQEAQRLWSFQVKDPKVVVSLCTASLVSFQEVFTCDIIDGP